MRDEGFEALHIQQRLRFDAKKGYGVSIDDGGNSRSLFEFMGESFWVEETEKQKNCGFWDSHVKRDGRCVLCESIWEGENMEEMKGINP